MRIGLVAKKLGMTRYFDESGDHHPVTILECPEAIVTKLDAKNNNVQLASFDKSKKNINKPQAKEYEKLKSTYKTVRKEFKTDKIEDFNIGSIITLNHFSEGQYVDVQGKTIGKGFAGGMKRHGFGGLEATHGVSISHRSHGSTGQCQDPGKVFKGKKMAGHMGDTNITVQNLEILRIDQENELIFIRGAVPGKKGALLTIKDAVKKSLPASVAYPARFKESNNDAKKAEPAKESSDKIENSADIVSEEKTEQKDS